MSQMESISTMFNDITIKIDMFNLDVHFLFFIGMYDLQIKSVTDKIPDIWLIRTKTYV